MYPFMNNNQNRKPANGKPNPMLKLNTNPIPLANKPKPLVPPLTLNTTPSELSVEQQQKKKISLSITNAYSPTPSTSSDHSPSVFSNEILEQIEGNSSSGGVSATSNYSQDEFEIHKRFNSTIEEDSSVENINTSLTKLTIDAKERLEITNSLVIPRLRRNFTKSMEFVMNKSVNELDEEDWKKLFARNEIVELTILGEGAGGSVSKCKLREQGTIFALKTITANPNPEFQKQILRELKFNKSCDSPYIVKYFGTFLDKQNSRICIAMEYMGGKSLDAIYKKVKRMGGRIGEKVLGKVAESVLRGLSYLHSKQIIHRDIKPQNILLNEIGEVKLCDFGVSGDVINSLASTFTGTSYYMAPERIKGESYTVTSDVWSLGLTLLEVAKGTFPYSRGESDNGEEDDKTVPLMPIELLSAILTFTPELNDEPEKKIKWSKAFRSFIDYCLTRDPNSRASPRQMLEHPWVIGQMKKTVKMDKFVRECWADENI